MKVYQVEFSFFNGVDWSNTTYEITAKTLKDLEEAVRFELRWMHEAMTIDEKWEEIKKRIKETTLEFPIIKKQNF